jgi:hypothetical protein
MWAPVEVVFDVVCAMLHFLSRKQLAMVGSWIEDGANIYKPSGDWTTSLGNRIVVRRAMRRAMKKALVRELRLCGPRVNRHPAALVCLVRL